MTHPVADVELVQRLHRRGYNQCEIAWFTGINRSSVGEWIRGGRSASTVRGSTDHRGPCPLRLRAPWSQYSYLLGLYLGDGCISLLKRGVYSLRITCCDAYPRLMDLCEAAIRAVMPENRVGRVQADGCTDVYAYSKHWPCLFPQHGPGRKHERAIRLEQWQRDIVEACPKDFLMGLIHSDGTRCLNTVVVRGRTYRYQRYQFTNVSEDIKGLFCWACDLVGVEWRVMNSKTISVAKRDSVALLDTFIGPKT